MHFDFIYNFTKFEILIEFNFSHENYFGSIAVYDVIKKLKLSNFLKVGIFHKYLFKKFALVPNIQKHGLYTNTKDTLYSIFKLDSR